jgi:hypothetical protein
VGESYSCLSGASIHAGRSVLPVIVGDQRITLWGQSNGWGIGAISEMSAAPLSADAGLAAFAAGTFDRVWMRQTDSGYIKLTPGSQISWLVSAGCIGPEFGIAVRWMRETTVGNLYIDKNAGSGIDIYGFRPSGSGYISDVGRRTLSNAWLAARGITVTDAGWVWVQGESDYAQTQSYYQTALQEIIDHRTTDGLQNAATKRLLWQMYPTSNKYAQPVFDAKVAIAASSPSNTVAPVMPNHFNADNLHINARGQIQLGYDSFAAIFGFPALVA